MKTKYSICILMTLVILFAFTSCEKDELDTWVSIEVSKTEVVADGTKVTFNVSGNAETYVIYTGDAGHEFAKSYLVLTEGKKIDQEEFVLTQAKLDTWWETPITGLKAEIDTWNAVPANTPTPIDKVAVFAGLKKLVDIPYYLDTAAQRLRELMPTLKTYSQCVNLVSKDNYFSNKYVLSQAKLDTWTPFLTAEIDAWNAMPANTPIDKVAVFAKLKSLVNKLYYFDDAKNLLIGILSPFKTDSECEALLTSNTSYFTKNKVLLAPVGGFSTGVALNRNNLTYSYTYKTPGPFTVTVLGTKIGQKNYSGSGYIDDRTSSASEYNYKRNTATVVVP